MLDRWFSRVSWFAPVPLRLVIGVVFFMHGSQKLFGAFGGRGIAGAIAAAQSVSFAPAWFWGWALACTEFVGGVLLLLGLLTRYAALALCIPMVVAVFKVHLPNGFFLPRGFEFALAMLMGLISLLFSGPGGMTLNTGKK
jgi:putative oxidoreductase